MKIYLTFNVYDKLLYLNTLKFQLKKKKKTKDTLKLLQLFDNQIIKELFFWIN